jgi:hypothetical protein
MKKVLILAYDFPPCVSVGGLRPKSWFDYFKEFDIEPIIITRQWSNKHKNDLDYIEASDSKIVEIEESEFGKIIRTPYQPNLSNRLLLKYGANRFRLIRKLITAYFEFFQFVFNIGPKAEIIKAAEIYLSQNKVDCILASADPFVLFHYASKLSKKCKTPWIADYRDAWSTIFERQNKPLEKAWNTYFEKKTLPTAQHIVSISEFVEMKTKSVFHHEMSSIIPNGFDNRAIEKCKTFSQNSELLHIAMIGSILAWNPIDYFFSTMNEFVLENPELKLKITFFGINQKSEFETQINADFPNLSTVVSFTKKYPNDSLLQKVSECNALLLFNYYSFMGTKIYDYIGLKRKIILCFTNDEVGNQMKEKYFPINSIKGTSNQLQADLIAETNSGIAVKDAEHLKKVLADLSEEFERTGQIACHSRNVENYSRKIQTEKLANLIKSIC